MGKRVRGVGRSRKADGGIFKKTWAEHGGCEIRARGQVKQCSAWGGWGENGRGALDEKKPKEPTQKTQKWTQHKEEKIEVVVALI